MAGVEAMGTAGSTVGAGAARWSWPAALRSGILRALAPPAAFLAVSVGLTWPAWSHPTTRLIGVGANPDAKAWFFAWFAAGLVHGHLHLVTTLTSAPHPTNLMWNNSALALAALFAPLTRLAGPVAAYNAALTLSLAASGWVAGLALRRFVRRPLAAWIAGAAFGFSPFVLAEADTGHLTWVTLWSVPLLLLLLDSLVRSRRRSAGWLGLCLGVWTGVELLTAEELFTTLVLVAVGALVGLALTNRRAARKAWPRLAIAAATAAPVALLIAGLPLWVQFLGPGRLVGGTIEPPLQNVADLLAVILPTQLQALAPPVLVAITQHFTGNPFDRVVYLGAPLLVFLGWVVASGRRDPRVRFFAWLGVLVFTLALGSHLHIDGRTTPLVLPWALPAHLPLLRKVLPDRLMAEVWLAVAALIALGLDRLSWGQGRALTIRSAVLVGLVALSLAPAGPELASAAAVPAFFRTSAPGRIAAGGTLLTTPIPDANNCTELLWQAAADFTYRTEAGCLLHAAARPDLIVSYLGFSTLRQDLWATQSGRSVPVGAHSRPGLLARLAVWRVRAIAVGPGPGERTTLRFVAALLQERPVPRGGVYLFRVRPHPNG